VLNILALRTRRRNYFLDALRVAARARGIIVNIVGADSDRNDPFVAACDEFVEIPEIMDTAYVERLFANVSAHQINLIIGWNDSEIRKLQDLRSSLPNSCLLAAPDVGCVNVMYDKKRFKDWCSEEKLPIAAAVEIDTAKNALPLVVKPRYGQGGVDVFVCRGMASLHAAIEAQTGEFLVEKFIEGIEYTVDVIAVNGLLIAAVPRRRLKVRGGEVMIAQVEMSSEILILAQNLTAKMNISGIYNFQVIKSNEGLSVIEMNPRFGGGSDLTIAAGVDLAGAHLDIYVLGKSPVAPINIKNGLIMTRRFESTFITN